MAAELCWKFVVDAAGSARPERTTDAVAVETIEPGDYVVTLPLSIAREFGLVAGISDDAGFIAAAPGDDAGNMPKTLRVLTMAGDVFAPRDFTVVVRSA